MARLIWLSSHLHASYPHCIRTRALIRHLSADHEIHVVSLDAEAQGTPGLPYVGHRVPAFAIGSWYRAMEIIPWSSCSGGRKCQLFFGKALYRILQPVIHDITSLYMSRYLAILSHLLGREDFGLIISGLDPYSSYRMAIAMKHQRPETQWILDIGDPLLGNSARGRQTAFTRRRMMRVEGTALGCADAVMVTTPETKDHFVKHYGRKIAAHRIHVVPMGADPAEAVVSHEKPPDAPPKVCRLVYAGRFYARLREPYALYEAVRSLQHRNVQLLIYGPPPPFVAGDKADGTSIQYRGFVSHDAIPHIYAQSDIVVFCDNAFGVQMSGKIFELIAARRPLLCIYENEQSATLNIIRDYPAAVRCKNNPSQIAAAITSILANYSRFSYDFDIRPFLWETRACECAKVIASVLRENHCYGPGPAC